MNSELTRDRRFLESGLTRAEVVERRERGEGNAVPFESSRSYQRILADNALSPVNVILFAISGVLVGLGLFSDAVLTAGLVITNIAVGVFQEGRAKRQLDQIALLTRPQATVLRDGEVQVVDPDDIVRGDLMVLSAGDEIQVDGPVLSETGLSVDESLLTGESDLIPKHEGDQLSSGSYCMTGEGRQLAERVATERVSHRIAARARSFKNVRTPLQQEVGIMVWTMAVVVVILGGAVANSFFNIYDRLPLVESTRAAAVVVALVPQGLWFMITVAYSMAVVRTARRGVLIQRMNAVESVSRVDVLCLDKTGTLTTNQLNLETLQSLDAPDEEFRRLLGDFAASASFRNRTSETILAAIQGEPREVRDEVVFDSARKWSALVMEDGVYVLGAPEMLVPSLTAALPQDGIEGWTAQGLRVLLFARGDAAGAGFDDLKPELPAGLQPLGFVVMRDELRADAADTAERFEAAGVRLKIISGDNPDTVAALARQAGMTSLQTTLSGTDLGALSESELAGLIEATDIFGRITPDEKEMLVRVLQQRGHYVAMIGDGVNDIPALKAAHVAVAMQGGSPATRSVADVVLLNNSFAALSTALVEGQRIRQGMEGIIRLFLVRAFAVSIIVLGAALASDPFPFTPRQTGLIAMLTVGIPALALAAWAKPSPSPRLILPGAIAFVMPAALTVGIACLAVYSSYIELGDDLRARTVVTAVSVFCGIGLIPYAVRQPGEWLSPEGLKRPELVALAAAMLACFFVCSMSGSLRDLFELAPLRLVDYLIISVTACAWAVALKGVWHFGLDEWLHDRLQGLLERSTPRSLPESD